MPSPLRRRPVGGFGALRMLERTGLRKGMAGNRSWFYLGTGLWTLRTVRRLAERREEVLISEQLRPGERIIIANDRATIDVAPGPDATAETRRGRRGRRAAKGAAKAGRRARRAG
jgi:hypothetical protein